LPKRRRAVRFGVDLSPASLRDVALHHLGWRLAALHHLIASRADQPSKEQHENKTGMIYDLGLRWPKVPEKGKSAVRGLQGILEGSA
jgi:hypothetical protein